MRRRTNHTRAAAGVVVLLTLVLAFAVLVANRQGEPAAGRVIVLGIDGMDYSLTARLMAEGQLPNLSALAERGHFGPLETSMPPLSPVAWTNFITGANPGVHGVFDFLRREPAEVRDGFAPRDAVCRLPAELPPTDIPFTSYVLPAQRRHELVRKTEAFWEPIARRGIPVTIVRVPGNFPASPGPAQVLAGMGTPDIEGGYGRYTYFTDDRGEWDRTLTGGRVVRCQVRDGVVHPTEADGGELRLIGPPNPFAKASPQPSAEVPLEIYVDREARTLALRLGEQEVVLKQGEWTPWLKVQFLLVPGLKSAEGIVRFYAKEVAPALRVIATPVNLAPGAQDLASGNLDRELADAIGPYATAGMPEMTKPLADGVFTAQEYMAQSDLVLAEQQAQFDYLLRRGRSGLLFFYSSSLDLDSHVFWGPHCAGDGSAESPRVIDRYRVMDQAVGRAMAALGPRDVLYVMSDHGFGLVEWHFSLVRWLQREGYLAYKAPLAERSSRCYGDVDWERTRAYPVGFSGLFVNFRGREAVGCVEPRDRESLALELRRKLLSVRDEATGRAVFANVYRPADVYRGPCVDEAPDLVLGYAEGFAPSDESAIGTWSVMTIGPNDTVFTGHHVGDFRLLPGVLFCSRRLSQANARLEDVSVTVLKEFGLGATPSMTGRPLY